MDQPPPGIGTLRETPLHASLKFWYSLPDDRVETPVDGFVIDLVRGDLLIEIQTRGFSSMRTKIDRLLGSGHRLRVVHPIAVERWIVKVDGAGVEMSRRRSPRKGTVLDLFSELVSIPLSIERDGFEIELAVIVEEEIRHHTPGKSWRRKGWSTLERRLVEVRETRRITTKDDLVALLPRGLPETFTTADIAAHGAVPRRVGQQTAYCLRKMGITESVGKEGNTVQYRLV